MRIGIVLSLGLLLLSACGKPQALKPRVEAARPSKSLDLETQRAYMRQVREQGEKDLEEVRSAPYDPLAIEIPAQTKRFDERRAEFQRFLNKLSPVEVASLRGELDTLIFTLRAQGLELHGYALARQLRGFESCLSDLKRASEKRRTDEVFDQVQVCIDRFVLAQTYVKEKKLERLLYVAPVMKSFPQTASDLGGPRDMAEKALVEKSRHEPSLLVLHSVKTRLESLGDSAFEMGRLGFLSGEDRTGLLSLVTSLKERTARLRESLRLTPPIEKIGKLSEVYQ